LATQSPYSCAADIFDGAKTAMQDNAGSDSAIYKAMLVAGLIAGALTGFLSKNWVAGIAGFAVGAIFLNIGMGIVGLT